MVEENVREVERENNGKHDNSTLCPRPTGQDCDTLVEITWNWDDRENKGAQTEADWKGGVGSDGGRRGRWKEGKPRKARHGDIKPRA